MESLDPNKPIYYEVYEGSGLELCDLSLKKDWIEWIAKRLPANAASLAVESVSFLPSPECIDIGLLLTPKDFSGKDCYLPPAFRGNPGKLTELARFNGALLLARLRIDIDRGRRFDEEQWGLRLRKSISISTIRDVFPDLPSSLVQRTPASAYPMTTENVIKSEHRRIQGVVNWIIGQARSKPKQEVVTAMVNRIMPSSSAAHQSVRTYLGTRRLKPMLPNPTNIITDLYVARTGASAAAKNTALTTLRPAIEQLRQILRDLGEYAKPLILTSWRDEELTLVLMAITEVSGQDGGQMTEQEVEQLFSNARRRG